MLAVQLGAFLAQGIALGLALNMTYVSDDVQMHPPLFLGNLQRRKDCCIDAHLHSPFS